MNETMLDKDDIVPFETIRAKSTSAAGEKKLVVRTNERSVTYIVLLAGNVEYEGSYLATALTKYNSFQ